MDLRLKVRRDGGSVELTGCSASQPHPGKHGFVFGFAPSPVGTWHPIVIPWLNHRHDCPTLHMPVPFAQLQPHPSVPARCVR